MVFVAVSLMMRPMGKAAFALSKMWRTRTIDAGTERPFLSLLVRVRDVRADADDAVDGSFFVGKRDLAGPYLPPAPLRVHRLFHLVHQRSAVCDDLRLVGVVFRGKMPGEEGEVAFPDQLVNGCDTKNAKWSALIALFLQRLLGALVL